MKMLSGPSSGKNRRSLEMVCTTVLNCDEYLVCAITRIKFLNGWVFFVRVVYWGGILS